MAFIALQCNTTQQLHEQSDQYHWVKPITLIYNSVICKRDQWMIKLTIEYQELSHCLNHMKMLNINEPTFHLKGFMNP